MTRYFVFVCETYYPCGGMGDCTGVFDTLDAAKAAAAAAKGDYRTTDVLEVGENLITHWMERDGSWTSEPFKPGE